MAGAFCLQHVADIRLIASYQFFRILVSIMAELSETFSVQHWFNSYSTNNLKVTIMRVLVLLLSIIVSNLIGAENGDKPSYFNQTAPDTIPLLFAPGLISTNMNEFNATFSPDGNEFYFSIRTNNPIMVICEMHKNEKGWSNPELMSFSDGKYMDADPFLSKDGNTLYFCSTRPAPGRNSDDWNIWKVQKTKNGWGEPEYMEFNTEKNEMYVSLSENGNVYYHCDHESMSNTLDINHTDIYCCRFADGHYSPSEKINAVSSAFAEWDPFISPDESYLIFTSTRPGGYGSGDMYISFKDEKDNWSEPVNMGPVINSRAQDYCPNLSPDGRYLFFSSYRSKLLQEGLNYTKLKQYHTEPQSGTGGDIYWVKSSIIEKYQSIIK